MRPAGGQRQLRDRQRQPGDDLSAGGAGAHGGGVRAAQRPRRLPARADRLRGGPV